MGKPVFGRTRSAREWLTSVIEELMPVIKRYLNSKGMKLHITVEVVSTHRLADYIEAAQKADPPITARTKEFQAVWASEVRYRLRDTDERFCWHEAEQLLGVTRLERTFSKVVNLARYGRILAAVHDIMPR